MLPQPTDTVNVGEATVLQSGFDNPTTGDPADPPSVDLTVVNPAGASTTIPQANLDHPSPGVYRYVLIPGTSIPGGAGVWRYRFDGGPNANNEWAYLLVDTGPRSTLCSAWASVEELDDCGIPSTIDDAAKRRAIDVASDLLWRWTGFAWPGVCAETIRPCARPVYVDRPGGSSILWDESWGYCSCSGPHSVGCSCQTLPEIRLGRAPILGVTEVRVDGAVLAATAYEVVNHQALRRLDGEAWPCCQNMAHDPASETDTFQVSFLWGENPPPSARAAATTFAVELAKACSGGDCALDPKVTQVARQGTTLQFVTPQSFGRDQNGYIKTGNRVVDYFLSLYPQTTPGLLVSPDSLAVHGERQ